LVVNFYISGVLVSNPENWEALEMQSIFNPKIFNQASLMQDEFIFVNDAAVKIIEELKGQFGAAQGIPIRIEIEDETTLEVYDGYISTKKGVEIVSPVKVKCKVRSSVEVDDLNDRLNSATFDLLIEKGIITKSDYENVELVRVKLDIANDILQLTILIQLFSDKVQEYVQAVKAAVQAWSDIDPLNPATIATAIERTIYAVAFLAIAYVQLKGIYDAFGRIIPQARNRNAITFKKGLEKAFQYAGLGFETSITDFDNMFYIPTHFLDEDLKKAGTPSSSEAGYVLGNFVNIAMNLTNARVRVVNDVVQMHTESSVYWQNGDKYKQKDILNEAFSYNVPDLKSTFLMSYQTDSSNSWSLKKYKGTAYEVTYTPERERDERSNELSGLEEVRIPMAKANHFVDNNGFISILLDVATVLRNVLGLFGGSGLQLFTKPASATVMVSDLYYSIPILAYRGATYRNEYELLAAKSLYLRYYNGSEFSQRTLVQGNGVEFKLKDWNKVNENSKFSLADGTEAEMSEVNWKMGKDIGTPNYFIREDYTTNIIKSEHEPD